MAKTKLSEWSATASSNTDINSINIAEGMAPSDVNNAIREMMAQLKDFQTGADSDNLTVGGNLAVTGTAAFTGAVTLPDDTVTFAKMQNIATSRVLGRTTAGSGDVEELTAAQVTALIPYATDSANGVVELATTAEAQAGTSTTRVITPSLLKDAQVQMDTPQASTSGTFIDFTGIPSWVKKVTIAFAGVSFNAGANPMVQIGAGSFVTSGYLSAGGDYIPTANHTSATNGFIQSGSTSGFGAAGNALHGIATLVHIGSNTWVFSSTLSSTGTANTATGSGYITLGGSLDRVRITSAAGTASFDAGTINILYE